MSSRPNPLLKWVAAASLPAFLFYSVSPVLAGPDSAARLRQGKTLYEKGRIGEALKEFEEAGDDPEALYYRFRIYFEDLRDTLAAFDLGGTLRKKFPASDQAQRVANMMDAVAASSPPKDLKPAPVKPSSSVKAKPVLPPALPHSFETAPAGSAPRPPESAAPQVPTSPTSAGSAPPAPQVPAPPATARPRTDTPPAVAESSSETPPEKIRATPKAEVSAKKKPVPEPAPAGSAAPRPQVPTSPTSAGSAPPAPNPAPPKEREPVVQVNLTADLKDFLKGISELTGENFLYDQNVSGQVIMSGPADVPMSQVMDLTQRVLAMRGFTLVRMGQGWKVTPSSVALRENLPVYDTPSAGVSQEYITQIIRIDPRLSFNEIRGLITSYFSPNHNIQAMPKLNLILLTDTRENIEKVMALIRRLTELQGRIVIKSHTLKFAKVGDIKSRVESILASYLGKTDFFLMPIVESNMLWIAALPEDIRRIEGLIKDMDIDFEYDVRMTVIPLQYASEDVVAKLVGELLQVGTAKYAADNFKIIPDPRRRSVILSSVSPHLIALVTKLVGEIDQPSVPRAENIHIYKIGNADALKIADKLNTLYKDQGGADRVGIVADEQSNSLIITANAQRFLELQTVIQKLDQSKSQVWLEVYVVEVSADMTKKIGVQWFGETTKNVRGTEYTGGIGVVTGTTPGQEGLTFGLTKKGIALPSAFNAFLDNKDFDVLSTPHLLVKDNEQAKIAVGDVIPILQNSQVTPTGSVTRTFSFENVGTNLSITPHVNRPRVTLDFTMSIQEVKSVAEIGAPTRTSRDLTTTITVESDQTVVLGGILGKRKTYGQSGVPVLSKLPGIGWLFRKDVYENKRTNLLIFITPKILDTAEELEQISQDKKDEASEGHIPDPGSVKKKP